MATKKQDAPLSRLFNGSLSSSDLPELSEMDIQIILVRTLCQQPKQSCKNQKLADCVFKFLGTFGMRIQKKNRDVLRTRVYDALGQLIEAGAVEEYSTATTPRLKLASDYQIQYKKLLEESPL